MAGGKILKNNPLVEAIFELRWELRGSIPGTRIEPTYKILIGSIYDKVKDEYPYYEQLPTATIPDEVVRYIVQHRFRKDKDKWPLIQIGPGIITLNDTEGYVWEDFKKRIENVIDVLFEVYPQAESNLEINRLLLRYIDAVDFDYAKQNAFDFLKKLKVNIEIDKMLFEGSGVSNLPYDFDIKFSFSIDAFDGILLLRFLRGRRKETDVFIWETNVQSINKNVYKSKDQIMDWVNNAHELTHSWFFKMIDGELRRRFE